MTHFIAYRGHCGTALAAMRREYLSEIMKNANDLSVTAGVLLRPPVTEADEETWLERILKKSASEQVFAILHTDTTDAGSEYRYVGHTGIHQIIYPERHGNTGSLLFEKGLHGKGCGTEAKLLLLHHAFHVKGLRKLSSEVKAFNANSLGHLLKCGYRIIGRRKQHRFHEGRYADEILLEVFRADFESIWEKYQKAKQIPKLTDKQRALVQSETGMKEK